MIFLPIELASLLEAKLNETQEGQESPFIFKTSPIVGAYDTDYFTDENGEKKEYVYSEITDPVGEVVPIRGTNYTIQQTDLHILFKVKYRKKMFYAIDTSLNNMNGLYMEVAGTELSSGTNTKVSFVAQLPFISEPLRVTVKSINENGLEVERTETYLDVVITINMATSSNQVLMGNEFTFSLTKDIDTSNPITERLACAQNMKVAAVAQTSAEQKVGDTAALAVNSTAQFVYTFAVFVCRSVTTGILNDLIAGTLDTNKVYQLKIERGDTTTTANVVLTNVDYENVFGGISILFLTATTADYNLILGGE